MAYSVSLKPQQKGMMPLKVKSPWKGINTIDSLAEMAPDYALSCQNFVATPLGLTLREGYYNYSTGFTNPISSLLVYNGRSNINKMFAVAGGSIFDASASGAVGAAVVTGLTSTSPYWQYSCQSTTGSVNYLIAMNGTDAPRLYNGSTWTTCTQVSSPSTPGQFGTVDQNSNSVSISNFIDVCLHAQRWWFVPQNSTLAYYIGIGAVGGICQAFDFGPFFPRGGTLKKLASWTIDTGSGIDYILVAISNKGDIVLYTGNDPTNATTWALTGQYSLGSPIGQRCIVQLVGDLGYLSQDGLYPLSKYIQSPRIDVSSALTYSITPTIQALYSEFGGLPGWEMCIYPQQKVMMLNVPQSSQAQNFQFVYDTINMAWTQFTGWGANCFCIYNDQLYFGGTNSVALAFQGYADNASSVGSGGTNIVGTALQAFGDLGYQGLKTIRAVKPYLIAGQTNPTVSLGINTDFNLTPITGSATLSPVTGATWGSAIWGSPSSTWVGSQVTPNQWYTPMCWPGEYIAITMSVSAASATTWAATNYLVSPGSSFG